MQRYGSDYRKRGSHEPPYRWTEPGMRGYGVGYARGRYYPERYGGDTNWWG